MTVTLTSDSVTVRTTEFSTFIRGEDIATTRSVKVESSPGQFNYRIRVELSNGQEAAEFPLGSIQNQPGWTNNPQGATLALNAVMGIAKNPSGGGGGQVDAIVAGDGIDVDSTDPVNPIVTARPDGVTIGFNGSGELQVPAAGGGYALKSLTISTTAPLTGGGDLSANRTLSIPQANGLTDGFLDSADWTTFNNKQPAGTYVTAVSVASANGFAGSSSGGATPALTLSTTITGILSANGTAISAAPTTGSGKVVLETSPTLTTPNLGTPTSGTLTNCTGLPAANVINTPAGTIAATDVQAAINELDTEKYPQSDIKRVVLTADSTPTTSATYVDVTGMVFTLEANTYYSLDIIGAYQSANTGTGVGIAIATTGSPSFTLFTSKFISSAGNAVGNQAIMRTDDSGTIATAVTNTNVNLSFQVRGFIFTGGTTATVQARIARGGSSNNVFMSQGSYMRAEKVG